MYAHTLRVVVAEVSRPQACQRRHEGTPRAMMDFSKSAPGAAFLSGATRRQFLVGGAAAAALAVATSQPGAAQASVRPGQPRPSTGGGVDRGTIQRWGRDTWASLVAMTDPTTGLPADNISGPLGAPVRSGYTSPTNIGGYLWSTVVARDLGIISGGECRRRLEQTLTTMGRVRRHEQSGMFYNWYDETNGDVVTVWPEDGNTTY